MPSCAYRVVKAMWQSNTSTLPWRRYQKSAVGKSILAPVGLITPAGVWNGPRKVPWIESSMLTTSPMPLSTPSAANRSLNPLGVQGSTLPVVVRAQDDREIAPLALGQV